jgi:Ca2+-transporting ATPase
MQILSLPGLPDPTVVARHARAARRLRLAVPGLIGGDRLARQVERALLASGLGVERAAADPVSGRVLVRYAADAPLLDHLTEVARPRRAGRGPALGDADRMLLAAPWYALPVDEALARLGSGSHGLGPDEAARRLGRFGPNALPDPTQRSRLAVLRAQVDNLPSLMLLGSAGLSALIRDFFDAGAILSAVGIDAAIGYTIERKNEDLLASWRELEAGEARVLRRGALSTVSATALVPGDVILCRAGETVPADARVIDAHRLACDEALLTGESESRAKSAHAVGEDAPLAERSSMLFAGTTVVAGHGRALVTATGTAAEAARIRTLLEREEAPKTPFERRLEVLGRTLTLGGAASGVAAGLAGLARGRPFGDVARNAVALAVAAIPEGLPVVATAALVQSMRRMRQNDMVVRRLVSAETLGGVTVVCADKTGTLTRNEMALEVVDLGGGPLDPAAICAAPEKLFEDGPTLALAAAALNSDVDVADGPQGQSIAGSSTERALVSAATAAGLDRAALRRDYPRRILRERNADVHYVVSLHGAPDGGFVVFVKGAPEQVLPLCERDLAGPLDDLRRERALARNHELAADGLRVLGLAWRSLEQPDGAELERGLTWIGLVGLRDPLRPDAAEVVRAARRAGIRTVIVTGDQRPTAQAIARAVGLEGETVDGGAVARLLAENGEEIRARLARIAVFSRVTPADKATLVRALRETGEIVAMAGDGINDAPALKAADVGIAIGAGASDVSREAADIVLASEDLRAVLAAVGEGRVVQDNLRRTVRFLLATNFAEVALALGAAVLGTRDPFTPLRLLWLNLLSDSLPALALALEPAHGDVLARPPAPPGAPLVPPESRGVVVRDGLLLAGLAGGSLGLAGPAVAFSALAGAELGYALACRSPGTRPDGQFLGLLGGTAVLHAAALVVPPLRTLLGLPAALSALELAGFGAGIVLPWAISGSRHGDVIVRRGSVRARRQEDPA